MKKTLFALTLLISSLFLNGQSFNGFALYNAQGSNTTYLIDENQNIAYSWSMNTECNYTVQLKHNGNLVRGTKNNGNILSGAADAGRVEEIAPDGTIVWDYVYSTSEYLSHHDLTLIGDNVLLTAWEVKTVSELNDLGYINANSDKWPTHFIELAPDGNGGAEIIWEWHIWDHLIQDVDSSKQNYGVISDNPQLIDINIIQSSSGGGPGGPGGPGGGGDWFHVNGVDYNEELDQIVFSSRHTSEIYIIDHSTTTAEAASHTGGNSGMGGDIMYRWGNPSNYNVTGQQVIPAAVHDVRWIANDGRPNGGFLQIFNNSGVSNSQSTIDGIETTWDETSGSYLRSQGMAFAPSSYTTRYECAHSAPGQSSSDRMSNGNIYINASGGQSGAGVMYEVDESGNIIWGPYNAQSQKGFRYECDYPGIIALKSYMNTATTSCFNETSISEISSEPNITIFPNPTRDEVTLNFESINKQDIEVKIVNCVGEEVFLYDFENYKGLVNQQIDFSSVPQGLYFLQITVDKARSFYKRITHIK